MRVLLATLFALALWQGTVWLTGLPPFLLPSPAAVASALWINRAEIAAQTAITATEVLAGFLLGSLLGAGLAIAMAASRRLRDLLRPLLLFSQTIPIFALAPILTLWLGYDMAPKIAMTVLITFFPVASAFLDGLIRTPPTFLDLAQTMGARPSRILWHIRVPAALPALGTGLRLASVYAPIGAVIGEWVGGSRGLGALMIHANGRMKIDQVFAALIVLALLTIAFHRLVGYLWTLAVDRRTMD